MSNENGMVRCEGCDRWVDLEVAPFEAQANCYRCALSIKIEVLWEMLENGLLKAKAEWREREDCIWARLEKERTARMAEQKRR